MKPILTIISLFLCVSFVYGADQVVSIRTVTPAKTLEPGKKAVLTIELDIAPPYHINSDRPLQDYLIPTTLEFEPQPGVTFGKPLFPAAPVKKLPVSESPMAVYEGTVKIAVEIIPSANFSSKEIAIKGKVGYQACNESYCLPPTGQKFSLALPVAVSASTPVVSPPSTSIRTAEKQVSVPSGATEKKNPESSDFANKSLLAVFVLVFLGGLALNLTPCVYPMIPITITYFGGQAEGKKGSLLAHSSLYVVGMAVMYSILGVVAAMTGGLFGAAQQYPPVLIGIALVMVALALSMFGVYELRMPQFLNRLAGSSQKGFWGTFLMGLTVGIVAAPCIGPFVFGLLTYVGNRGNPLLGFSLFFVLALGLGIPFLVLGMFSGSIRRLPRSGAWMIWVRKIFGFVLLAMAVFFLKPLFPSALAYHLSGALILLVAGVYLALIDKVPGSGKAFSCVRSIVGIAFLAGGLYAAVTGLESNLENARIHSMGENPSGTIQWLPYSESILGRASQERKAVFIDFYADWCAPCKELDTRTYSAPEVVARSKEFVMVKVDLTLAEDPRAEMLRKKYQVRGVPTLLFLNPDGQEIPDLRGTGFETKEIFLDKMNRALQYSAGAPKGTM
jgi:thioredoxin:protein disulfide reductase